jgi:IS1 family transposase/transposase-like protein
LAGKGQVNCICCNGIAKRRGFYRNKNFNVQRFECLKCGTSFSDKQPLDNLRVDFKQACRVLDLITEGVGINAVSRLTGLNKRTVLNVLARAGSKAGRFLDDKVRNVLPESVQADEMFCFVGCKDRANIAPYDPFRGSQYLFMAIDSKSKLIISHVIGQRSNRNTENLLNDLKGRVVGRMQLTTDGFEPYKVEVPRTIGSNVDFAQLVKQYANPRDLTDPERRYSPTVCTGARKVIRCGKPNPDRISTSYMERTNLTVRLFNRRFTRLTLGYSKKFEYLIHSINLMIFHFNFIHIHSAHGQTPAMAADLTTFKWTFQDLLLTPE